MATAKPKQCFFLDILPAELRLMVYEHLLVTQAPIRGQAARKRKNYGLDLTIMRVNRQTYTESKAIFYGKNTFYVTSYPDIEQSAKQQGSSECTSRFDPPLQPQHLPLIRHLELDLLYYPADVAEEAASSSSSRQFSISLVSLLRTVQLQTLSLTAEPHPDVTAKQCLASFFICDRDRAFAQTLAALSNVKEIPISFEFKDCFYRTVVSKEVYAQKSILLLACQVMFCQSRVRIDQMMKDFEEGRLGEADGEWQRERVDLGPLVRDWPSKVPSLGELMLQAKELEREMAVQELWASRMH